MLFIVVWSAPLPLLVAQAQAVCVRFLLPFRVTPLVVPVSSMNIWTAPPS